MVNKKGALFHWIIFGVLAAFGLFFILANPLEMGYSIKGQWQSDFLKNYYLISEEEMLKTDLNAKLIIKQAVLDLSQKGGFNQKSECPTINNYNVWNKITDWKKCSPEPEKELIAGIKSKLLLSYPLRTYDLKLDGLSVYGKSNSESLSRSTNKYFLKYSYYPHFRITLDFDPKKDYETLKGEALELVNSCRNVKNLEKCITDKRKNNWKFKDCTAEKYTEQDRSVLFCVTSPQQVKIYDTNSKLIPLTYLFALDFTATIPFPIEKLDADVDLKNGFVEIIFDQDKSADSYNIYFTDYTFISSNTGTVAELKEKVFSGYFWSYKELKNSELISDPTKCASGVIKEKNKGYLCLDKVYYTLSDSKLQLNKDYLVAVTTVKSIKESEINSFFKFKYT